MSDATAPAATDQRIPLGPPVAARWSWIDYLLLALVAAIAIWIRIDRTDDAPSFDELWHLRLSAAKGEPLGIYEPDRLYLNPPRPTFIDDAPSTWHVWTNMDGVLHPPLYVFTLRIWRELFGESNGVAHAYSILWGVIAIAFTFAAARLALGRVAGILTALAMSLSTTQIYFGQEIRAYAMVTGLVAIGLWLITRIELFGPTRKRAIGLAALSLPLLLTHYFAFGAVVGFVVYGVWKLVGHRAAFLTTLSLAAAVYAVAWLPFAIEQVNDLSSGDVSWQTPTRDLTGLLTYLATAPIRVIIDRDHRAEPAGLAMACLLVLPILLVKKCRALLPWSIVLVSTLFCLFALDVARSTRVLMVTRYLAPASPAVFVTFVGCAAAIGRRWLAIVAATGLCIVGVIHVIARIGVDQDIQSMRVVVDYVLKRSQPGEAIVVYGGPGSSFYGDLVLMACSNESALGVRPYINLQHPITPEALRQVAPKFWLICGSQSILVSDVIPDARVIEYRALEFNLFAYYVEVDARPTTEPTQLSVPASSTAPSVLRSATP